MCVCHDEDPKGDPSAEDSYVESLIGGRSTKGVLVDSQTGRLAEASWD